MFRPNEIRINDIIYVNYVIGNEKGTHARFNVENCFYYQLLYKMEGEAEITFGETVVKETADCIRFLPNPKDFVTLPEYTAYVVEQGKCINVAFTTSVPLAANIFAKKCKNYSVLKELFKKLQKRWYFKREGYYYECISLLYAIFSVIEQDEFHYLDTVHYCKIYPAIEYIDNHFTENKIDCDHLAELCDISHTYMSRLFNNFFGESPKNYIIRKKIDYACDLLNMGEYSIKRIAFMCGFSDEYYFSKMFKKRMGICPSKYSPEIYHST